MDAEVGALLFGMTADEGVGNTSGALSAGQGGAGRITGLAGNGKEQKGKRALLVQKRSTSKGTSQFGSDLDEQ